MLSCWKTRLCSHKCFSKSR